ncbi:MAG: hypothetical protein ACREBR_01005 [bacterium]
MIQPRLTARENKAVGPLMVRLEEALRACNPYIKDFVTASEIPPDIMGPTHQLVFHNNAVPDGEHLRRYNIPGMAELCLVVKNMSYGYPPCIVRHRSVSSGKNTERLEQIHDCQSVYDMLHFVLLSPDGGGKL